MYQFGQYRSDEKAASLSSATVVTMASVLWDAMQKDHKFNERKGMEKDLSNVKGLDPNRSEIHLLQQKLRCSHSKREMYMIRGDLKRKIIARMEDREASGNEREKYNVSSLSNLDNCYYGP